MAELPTRASVCSDLVHRYADQLPRSLCRPDGRPSRTALQELFWSAAVEVVSHVLSGQPLPAEVGLGREHFPVAVSPDEWNRLLEELGLVESPTLAACRLVLEGIFAPQARSRPSVPPGWHGDAAGVQGLVIIAGYLEQISRHARPKSFRYEIGDLTHYVRAHLGFAGLERFDEVNLVREFFPYAGISVSWTDNLFRVPYHAYYRPLRSRLDRLVSSGTETPADDVVESAWQALASSGLDPEVVPLPEPRTEPEPIAPPVRVGATSGEAAALVAAKDLEEWLPSRRELQAQVQTLREEIEHLRAMLDADILRRLFTPILVCRGDPPRWLLGPFPEAEGMRRALAGALGSLLQEGSIETFGYPGERCQLQLPHADFQLDPATPPSGRDISAGLFRVTARGLRLNGRTLLPAHVAPEPGRNA